MAATLQPKTPRAIKPESLVEGAKRSSMDELTAWTQEADKVIVF
jgi:sulfur relay (sulfurtransferase) complex TusBCD TusD component (DsrE family)